MTLCRSRCDPGGAKAPGTNASSSCRALGTTFDLFTGDLISNSLRLRLQGTGLLPLLRKGYTSIAVSSRIIPASFETAKRSNRTRQMVGRGAGLLGANRFVKFGVDDRMIWIPDDVHWVQVLPHFVDFPDDHLSVHNDTEIGGGQTPFVQFSSFLKS